MSTHEDRFALTRQAYENAFNSWDADLDACAGSGASMRKVNANLRALHTEMLRAANAWLGATGAAVEDAFDAAKAAKKVVDDARENDVEIVARLTAFADLSDSIKALVDKAKKATPDA